MAVDRLGMIGGARQAILYLVTALYRYTREPKMDVRLKKTDSRIAGATFTDQPPKTGMLIGGRGKVVGQWIR